MEYFGVLTIGINTNLRRDCLENLNIQNQASYRCSDRAVVGGQTRELVGK